MTSTHENLQDSDSQEPHVSNGFEWLSRLARMQSLTCLIIDTDLKIMHCDDSASEFLEVSEELYAPGCHFLDAVEFMANRGDFGPGDASVFVQLIRTEIMKTSEDASAPPRKLELTTPSGRRMQFMHAHNGDHILFTGEDITDRHVDRHAMRIALSSSNSGYLIYDVETGTYNLRGDRRSNVIGQMIQQKLLKQGFASIVHPDDYTKVVAKWTHGLKTGEPWDMTYRVRSETGQSHWLRTHATPQLSENGNIASVILFYTDISSQIRVQTELSNATKKAEQALSAKNNFLGRLSHEVRTPMNAVVGMSDALIHHHATPDILPKLEIIQDAAEKIVRIVDETLQHAKLDEDMFELTPQPGSPQKVVRAVCNLWEYQAKKSNTTISLNIDSSVPDTIIFDDLRYEQCVNNLLSNAVKFASGGQIDVLLTTLDRGHQKTLVLAVKDNGIGMSPTQTQSIFNAFTQADKSISTRFGGTGLGLTITKQIIELMGGAVSVKSREGAGTVFAITLPIKMEKHEATRPANTSTLLVAEMLETVKPDASDYADLRVLVVDDNPTNHMVVKSLLESLVGSVVVAENGIEALAAIKTQPFDVVLMDIHMPIMDGIEATLSIRGSDAPWSTVPIIALTADPQYQQKRLCKNIGMDEALAKPVKLTEILGAFDRVGVGCKRELAA